MNGAERPNLGTGVKPRKVRKADGRSHDGCQHMESPMHHVRRLSPIGILVRLALAALATPVAAETLTVDFDTMLSGQPPTGFTTAVTGEGTEPEWVVQKDAGAPSGDQVLAQVSEAPARNQFPLAIYDGFSAFDLDLSVKIKPISGETDQAAGLVWRFLDKNNYYIVRANALEGNVVLYKVEDGARTDLPLIGQGRTYGVETAVPANRWSTLAVHVEADRATVSFNGTDLFEVQDETFSEAGKVGLWTKADSVTAFDDLTAVALE
jgi:hypothetical protein